MRRDWQCCNTKPKEADMDALNDGPHPAGWRIEMWCVQIYFLYQQSFIVQCLKSCFQAITYQIKYYFDFSNCKFTRSFLISAIWQGSPCRQSSDDANTDWVHCLSPRCKVKWQTVMPAIWSQRRRDVGCATATMATDANVVTMSPNVALLAGELMFYRIYVYPLNLCNCWAVSNVSWYICDNIDSTNKIFYYWQYRHNYNKTVL